MPALRALTDAEMEGSLEHLPWESATRNVTHTGWTPARHGPVT